MIISQLISDHYLLHGIHQSPVYLESVYITLYAPSSIYLRGFPPVTDEKYVCKIDFNLVVIDLCSKEEIIWKKVYPAVCVLHTGAVYKNITLFQW